MLPASCRCLLPPDPGAPGETRTHNTLLKRQVPLSNLATDANRFRLPIADVQLVRVLAGLTRLELAISASTVQRFDPTSYSPGIRRLRLPPIGNRESGMIWVGRRDLNPQLPQSQCGALPFELRPT